ncbi:FAD-dependent oxidoreductase domain-containing protein 2 [Bienertia sinuspersici]
MIDQDQWVEDMGSITTAFTQFYEKLLHVNENRAPLVTKYEIYCAGIERQIVERVKNLSGFRLGRLPFTYLGICSWVWKSFCKTKDQLISAGVDIMEPTYSIKKVYESLRPRANKIHWSKAIWCSIAVPKNQFMAWLAFRQRLLTKDRLKRMNLVEDQRCCLCISEDETLSHLLFDCEFSKECFPQIIAWLGLHLQQRGLQSVMGWNVRSCKGSKLKRQAYFTAVDALVYFIWTARNDLI